ncbi:hypothetical protein Hanom_Chr13g01215721 [Helianthus anomalus]
MCVSGRPGEQPLPASLLCVVVGHHRVGRGGSRESEIWEGELEGAAEKFEGVGFHKVMYERKINLYTRFF